MVTRRVTSLLGGQRELWSVSGGRWGGTDGAVMAVTVLSKGKGPDSVLGGMARWVSKGSAGCALNVKVANLPSKSIVLVNKLGTVLYLVRIREAG